MIMEESIKILSALPESAGILFCSVGELALQYYNVPRVVHVGQPVSVISCTPLNSM